MPYSKHCLNLCSILKKLNYSPDSLYLYHELFFAIVVLFLKVFSFPKQIATHHHWNSGIFMWESYTQGTKCNSVHVHWCQIFFSNIPFLSARIFSKIKYMHSIISVIYHNNLDILVHVSARTPILSCWTLISLEILSCLIKLSIISSNLTEFNDSPTSPVGNNQSNFPCHIVP